MFDEPMEYLHKIKNKINIVYGTGTDVGKTYTTIYISNTLFQKSKQIFVIKPIISGFTIENYYDSDGYKLLQAIGIAKPTLQEVLELYAYYFKEPLSPDIASWKEGIEIDFQTIVDFCIQKIEKIPENGKIFIETAGGVCTPCANFHIMADISKSLAHLNPCNILVATPYLGSISHTISALNVLKFDILIINKSEENFVKSIRNHLPYEVKILCF